MKSLLKYLKEYRKEAVLAPLFKLLEATFELIVPLVMAAIIDTGIGTQNRPYILKMCGVLVLLAAVGKNRNRDHEDQRRLHIYCKGHHHCTEDNKRRPHEQAQHQVDAVLHLIHGPCIKRCRTVWTACWA